MPYRIQNLTRQVDLATQARLAADPFSRLIGWLGRRAVASGEGLILRPCSSIHMFGMRFAIDALYLDSDGRVRHAITRLRPWRVGPIDPQTAAIIELPTGTLTATATMLGDQIMIVP